MVCIFTTCHFSICNSCSLSLFREVPKLKRKAPLSKKEKKDKEKAPKKEKEVAEIKVEGSESVDNVEDELKVEDETLEDPDGPRK